MNRSASIVLLLLAETLADYFRLADDTPQWLTQILEESLFGLYAMGSMKGVCLVGRT